MNTLLVFAFSSAVVTAGIFAAVYACKAWIRNPAVLHALWVLVLLKLLTPPIWSPRVPLLPAIEPAESQHSVLNSPGEPAPREPANRQRHGTGESQVHGPSEHDSEGGNRRAGIARAGLSGLVVAGWGIGSLVWFALAGWRIGRFRRGLRFASEAPREPQQTRTIWLASLGLRRCPRVCLVPGRVSPMLWAFAGRARVILPDRFFAELDSERARPCSCTNWRITAGRPLGPSARISGSWLLLVEPRSLAAPSRDPVSGRAGLRRVGCRSSPRTAPDLRRGAGENHGIPLLSGRPVVHQRCRRPRERRRTDRQDHARGGRASPFAPKPVRRMLPGLVVTPARTNLRSSRAGKSTKW